jgi:hypothetical protein
VTAKTTSPEALPGHTLADRLRALGTRGVLLQMAQRGQILELRCEMPMCYCHKGRGYFEPRSSPLPAWAPTADHYPRLKADGGHTLSPGTFGSRTRAATRWTGAGVRGSDGCLRKECHSRRSPRT